MGVATEVSTDLCHGKTYFEYYELRQNKLLFPFFMFQSQEGVAQVLILSEEEPQTLKTSGLVSLIICRNVPVTYTVA